MFPLYREGYGPFNVKVYKTYVDAVNDLQSALNSAEDKGIINETIIEDMNEMRDGRVQVTFRKKKDTQTIKEALKAEGKVCVTLEELKALKNDPLTFE